MSLLALALVGCGEEDRGTTTYGPTATPTATSASPEDQPGGAGDEEPIAHPVALALGEEGFEPPEQRVPAFFALRLTVRNGTAAPQTVTVAGRPPLTVAPDAAATATLEGLRPGRHRVTLAGAPLEATLVADPQLAP